MDTFTRAENARDDAANRLDALKIIKATALDEIRATLQRCQEAMGPQDHWEVRQRCERELKRAMEEAEQTVGDLMFSELEEAQDEINAADDRMGSLEDADLHRSSPIVI